MAFFKFRSRDPQAKEAPARKSAAAVAAPAESVEAMRRRARHRLLGAAVLVLVGVIGFPLLFDTQPRPVSVDIPIEIPDRTKTPPLAQPAEKSSASGAVAAAPGGGGKAASSSPSSGEMITETAEGDEIAADKPQAKPEPKPEAKPETRAEAKPEPKPESKTEAKAEAKPEPKPAAKSATASDDAARARALLNGKTPEVVAKAEPAASDAGRFVVQVGAFNDADKARDVRQRLEKAGIKTYTSVAKTASGEWTRVRVGPFGSRAEAERVAEKVKGLSMPAAVLTL